MKKILSIFISLINIISFANIMKSNISAKFMQLNGIDEEITAKSYIQNGLIAQWDGIENAGYGIHNDNAYEWTDLITENNTTSTTPLHFYNDSLEIKAINNTINLNSFNAINALNNGQFTIEFVGFIEEFKSYRFYWITDNNNSSDYISFMTHFSGAMFILQKLGNLQNVASHGSDTAPYAAYGNVVANINDQSGNPNVYFYKNGIYIHRRVCTQNLLVNKLNIFQRNTGPIGKYYALRIYNRQLTENEIKHNYNIDKLRFNLP